VVLIISKEYVSSRSSMEELHLLLEGQRQGSPVRLLPVLYNITPGHLEAMRQVYTASDVLWQQQGASDMQDLVAITAIREDQVSRTWCLNRHLRLVDCCKLCWDDDNVQATANQLVQQVATGD
jgi:hypothetical protein